MKILPLKNVMKNQEKQEKQHLCIKQFLPKTKRKL